jgi:hypothetical protein
MRGQLSYNQNVVDKSNINNIIFSLDYRDFLDDQRNVGSTLSSLKVNGVKDKISSLLSLDSLKASIVTLLNQNNNAPN